MRAHREVTLPIISAYLSLRALRVAVEELRHVRHNGLLVRPVEVHVLWVQQPAERLVIDIY